MFAQIFKGHRKKQRYGQHRCSLGHDEVFMHDLDRVERKRDCGKDGNPRSHREKA
jgi:hypothetical protein